jgi:ADP-ribose pyrophosphatase YjhB (NUDIX family)
MTGRFVKEARHCRRCGGTILVVPRDVRRPIAVDLIGLDHLDLVEGEMPALDPATQAELDRLWAAAVAENPSLFDGPVAVSVGVQPRGRDISLVWARATFRSFGLRQIPGAPVVASLFVAVIQPTDDGRLLIGRMSPSTASPGRWQLPGGIVEPPTRGQLLNSAALRRHAATELLEETGADVSVEQLSLWLVTRAAHGNTVVIYVAPPQPAVALTRTFAGHLRRERDSGRDPELTEVAFVRSPADLGALPDSRVDYLDDVVAAFRRDVPRA